MARALKISGVDLTNLVTSWGQLEQVKEVLLTTSELFTSEHTVSLSNVDGLFNPHLIGSLFYGRRPQGSPVQVYDDDGALVFDGLLRSLSCSKTDRSATVVARDRLAAVGELDTTIVATAANPAAVALSVALEVLDADLVDSKSFFAAAADYPTAVISVDYSTTSKKALGVLKDICDLCSFSVYVSGGKLRARPFRPYQGSQSQLRQELTATTVIEIGELVDASDAYCNSVRMLYGADLEAIVEDKSGIAQSGGNYFQKTFKAASSSDLSIPDSASAITFALLYLARAIPRWTLPLKLSADAGPAPALGDRFPVTDSFYGFTKMAFEVIEVHRKVDSKVFELLLATVE